MKRLLLMFGLYVVGAFAEETFIEETGVKKSTPLTKARREAVDQLEEMAHALTDLMKETTAVLDDSLWVVRDITEGNKKACFMKSLQEDRAHMLKSLRETTKKLKDCCSVLHDAHTLIAQGIIKKK